jgi:hypothetical protein
MFLSSSELCSLCLCRSPTCRYDKSVQKSSQVGTKLLFHPQNDVQSRSILMMDDATSPLSKYLSFSHSITSTIPSMCSPYDRHLCGTPVALVRPKRRRQTVTVLEKRLGQGEPAPQVPPCSSSGCRQARCGPIPKVAGLGGSKP